MRLACPVEGTWTVEIAGSEKYVRDEPCRTLPKVIEYVAGKCSSCGSKVLLNPTSMAINLTRTRVTA